MNSKKTNSVFYLENTVMFPISPVLILGELVSLSVKYTLVTALQLGRLFVGSLPIIGRRCRRFGILRSIKELSNPLKALGLHKLCLFGTKTIVSW